MGKIFTDVCAPAGTPRFYGVRRCKGCNGEEIAHAAGQLTADALVKPCPSQRTSKKPPKVPTAPSRIPQHVAGLSRAVDDHVKALLLAGQLDTELTGLALDGAVRAYYEAERLGVKEDSQ